MTKTKMLYRGAFFLSVMLIIGGGTCPHDTSTPPNVVALLRPFFYPKIMVEHGAEIAQPFESINDLEITPFEIANKVSMQLAKGPTSQDAFVASAGGGVTTHGFRETDLPVLSVASPTHTLEIQARGDIWLTKPFAL